MVTSGPHYRNDDAFMAGSLKRKDGQKVASLIINGK